MPSDSDGSSRNSQISPTTSTWSWREALASTPDSDKELAEMLALGSLSRAELRTLNLLLTRFLFLGQRKVDY